MSLPPERISIKRRRQDDPVDTLYLELGGIRDPKRRFTDFCFQRLQQHQRLPESASQKLPPNVSKQRAASSAAAKNSIPVVRATMPGDEISETLRLKAAHRDKQAGILEHGSPGLKSEQNPNRSNDAPSNGYANPTNTQSPDEGSLQKDVRKARRFHLSREAGPTHAMMEYGGIRKPRTPRKSHVAIFVEKLSATPKSRRNSSLKSFPSDKIVELLGLHSTEVGSPLMKDDKMDLPPKSPRVSKERTVPSFVKSQSPRMKTGKSIQDPPSTWDHSSDQLADELAALALEFDNEESQCHNHVTTDAIVDTESTLKDLSDDEEFIYDTYLRLPIGQGGFQTQGSDRNSEGFGVLVIDEDNDDIWQSYIESDDDSDWDEEDADSNAEDNPANDYPEDELSSGDEFGYNSYKHRKDTSDGEGEDDLEDGYN